MTASGYFFSFALNICCSRRAMQEDSDTEHDEDERASSGEASRSNQASLRPDRVNPSDSSLQELQVLETCASRQLFEDMLSTFYIPMEVWYARTIINKVSFADGTCTWNADPLTSNTFALGTQTIKS